uniref:NADH dehydrogenase subunit 6 n=1 Tax=Leptestheria dahalacensis TaxID=202083 RepID=UPI0022A71BED|nr:NADH dehydrogenase subunit 6 [Leptestheria dahalacensis]UNY33482.1 NADH dehydrogenase subunit 6 [Leptestheria dahalacensis]
MFHLVLSCFLLVTLMFYFASLTHPLAMAFNLFLQTLLFCVLIGSFHSSYWLSYLLFLVFLGGLLIIFAYVSTLASNEKFFFTFSSAFFLFASFFLCWSLYMPVLKSELATSGNLFESTSFLIESQVADLYSFTSSALIYLVIYLLLCLLIVVRISRLEEGPLRSF